MGSIIWNNIITLVIDSFFCIAYFSTFLTLVCYISIIFSNYNSSFAYSHIHTQYAIHCTDADDISIELQNLEIWEKILNTFKIRQHIVAEVKVDSDFGLPSSF